MKKVLMLGGDYGSLEIVKRMHKRGIYVVVADYYEDTTVKSEADESWLVSTSDIEKIKTMCIENKIDGIICGASDFNVGNSRQICKDLNLPLYCSNDYARMVSINKYEFKKVCKEVGAPVATDYDEVEYLKDKENYKINFPVVVKPIDLAGNVGMSYCDDKEQLNAALKYAHSCSSQEKLIIERKLVGSEFVANYTVVNGEPRLLFLGSLHHQPGELANIYSVIISTNYKLKQYLDEVNPKVIAVFKKIGILNGVAWVQCMYDADGHFYLLEMAHRFGGPVLDIPYTQISGYCSLELMIDCSLGIKHTEADLPAEKYDYTEVAVSYVLFTNKDAVISRIDGLDQIAKFQGVMVDFPKKVGRKLTKNNTVGVIRFASKDIYQACETMKKINEVLVVKDENGDDLIIKYDNYAELTEEYENGLKE